MVHFISFCWYCLQEVKALSSVLMEYHKVRAGDEELSFQVSLWSFKTYDCHIAVPPLARGWVYVYVCVGMCMCMYVYVCGWVYVCMIIISPFLLRHWKCIDCVYFSSSHYLLIRVTFVISNRCIALRHQTNRLPLLQRIRMSLTHGKRTWMWFYC